jgi:hypothetical protein
MATGTAAVKVGTDRHAQGCGAEAFRRMTPRAHLVLEWLTAKTPRFPGSRRDPAIALATDSTARPHPCASGAKSVRSEMTIAQCCRRRAARRECCDLARWTWLRTTVTPSGARTPMRAGPLPQLKERRLTQRHPVVRDRRAAMRANPCLGLEPRAPRSRPPSPQTGPARLRADPSQTARLV